MARDTSTRVVLTDKLIGELDFERPVTGIDANGRLVNGKRPAKMKDWVLRDAQLPGFMVRVYPSKKTFQVQRKMGVRGGGKTGANSASVKRVVGEVGVLSTKEARKTAQLWLGQMAQGIDPHELLRQEAMAQAQEQDKKVQTFGRFFESYAKASGGIAEATRKDRQKVIKWMETSPLWRVPIHKVAYEDIDESLSPLFDSALGKTKQPKWGPESPGLATAWKIYRYMSAAYTSYIGRQGLEFARGTSPFATVRKHKKKSWPQVAARTSVLKSDEESSRQWLCQLVAYREDPRQALAVFADYLLLALIWGGRRRETQLLKWKHLDIEKGFGTFIAENTKSGKAHYFPLTPWALEILETRRIRNDEWARGGEWVFPSRTHGMPISDHRSLLIELKNETGVWLTAHDMRRTVATETADLMGGESLFVSMALGHTGGSAATTMRYIQRRVKLLRPIFEQRERNLREMAGLQTIEQQTSPIDTLIEFLEAAKSDPAERATVMKRAEAMLMMLQ